MSEKPSLNDLILALEDTNFISSEVRELYIENKEELYLARKSYLDDLTKDAIIISAYLAEAPVLKKFLWRIDDAVSILTRFY